MSGGPSTPRGLGDISSIEEMEALLVSKRVDPGLANVMVSAFELDGAAAVAQFIQVDMPGADGLAEITGSNIQACRVALAICRKLLQGFSQ